MPLIKSKSKKAMGKNIATEMHHGKPQKQAIAIAYAVRRKAMHKAHGGLMESPKEEMLESARHEAMESPEMERREHRMMDESLSDKIRRRRRMMAEGGMVHDSEADLQRNANEELNNEDQLSFEAARKNTYYDLDQVEEQPEDSNMHGHEMDDEMDMDMVGKIRSKMRKKMSV